MIIKKASQAGTLESNDVYIQLFDNFNNTIEIKLTSVVIKQFKEQILKVVNDTLEKHNITSCILIIEDKGALDHVIEARLESAIARSQEV